MCATYAINVLKSLIIEQLKHFCCEAAYELRISTFT